MGYWIGCAVWVRDALEVSISKFQFGTPWHVPFEKEEGQGQWGGAELLMRGREMKPIENNVACTFWGEGGAGAVGGSTPRFTPTTVHTYHVHTYR